MNAADLHAVALLGMVAATVALLLLAKRRKSDFRIRASALLISLLLFGLAIVVNSHACDRGNPALQCFWGSACVAIVLMFVDSRALRFAASGAITVCIFCLAHHYGELVHSREWTGSTRFPTVAFEAIATGKLRNLANEMRVRLADDNTNHDAGWLRDVPIADQLRDALEGVHLESVAARWAWHTAFTTLFRLEYSPLDVWYSGGRVIEAELSARPRPRDS